MGAKLGLHVYARNNSTAFKSRAKMAKDAGAECLRQQHNISIFSTPVAAGNYSSFDIDIGNALDWGMEVIVHLEPVPGSGWQTGYGGDWTNFDTDHYHARIPPEVWGYAADCISQMVDRMRSLCEARGLDPAEKFIIQLPNEMRCSKKVTGWGWRYGEYLRTSGAHVSGTQTLLTNASPGDTGLYGLQSVVGVSAATKESGYVDAGQSAATHVMIHTGGKEWILVPLASPAYSGASLLLAEPLPVDLPDKTLCWPVPVVHGAACLLDPGYLDLLDAVYGPAIAANPDLRWSFGAVHGGQFVDCHGFLFDSQRVRLTMLAACKEAGRAFAQVDHVGLNVYPSREYLQTSSSDHGNRLLFRTLPNNGDIAGELAKRTKQNAQLVKKLLPGISVHVSEVGLCWNLIGYGTAPYGSITLRPNDPSERYRGTLTARLHKRVGQIPELTHCVLYHDTGSDSNTSFRLQDANGEPTIALPAYLLEMGKLDSLASAVPASADADGSQYTGLDQGQSWSDCLTF